MDTYVFRTIARQQNPAVVAIVTTTWRDAASPEDAEWFERFFGRTLPRGAQAQREIASGFLISHDGDILTNEHVVADADVIEVRLMGRETTTYAATVVGRDPVSDSALIRLKDGPPDLPVAILGDSDALQTGDWVMAIGNPFQLGHSVSVGVVSYAGRSFGMDQGHWQKLIQTDASINPGNSGGPLLNVRGEVVGINVAVLADGVGDSMGIGFAVPINNVKAVLAGLRAGRVVRGSIGVQLRLPLLTDHDATALGLPRAAGALVTSVEKQSTADAAGFHAGDVIVEFLGLPVVSAGDFLAQVSRTPPGVRARVAVIRDGHVRTFDVEVETQSSPAPRRESHRVERPDLGLTLGDPGPSPRGPGRRRARSADTGRQRGCRRRNRDGRRGPEGESTDDPYRRRSDARVAAHADGRHRVSADLARRRGHPRRDANRVKESIMTTASITGTDVHVRNAVVRQLDWDPEVDAGAVGVSAHDGVVTLTGFVDSYAEKLAAERVAKRVRGVRGVANDITVRQMVGRTDADIAHDAVLALKGRPALADTVQVAVHRGHITLTGQVEWLLQKEGAERAVKHVRGLLGVFNHITVKPRSGQRDVQPPHHVGASPSCRSGCPSNRGQRAGRHGDSHGHGQNLDAAGGRRTRRRKRAGHHTRGQPDYRRALRRRAGRRNLLSRQRHGTGDRRQASRI